MAKPTNDNQKDAVEEAVQQFIDKRMQGREPDIDEFVKQYPELEHRIRQKIQNLRKIDTLFDSLVQADEDDFEDEVTVIRDELIGRKLGGFEIVEVIGRGGMGVVYLAHDTRLNRSVAIKGIPAKLADDSTARMRFDREAKLLASLNHPNIAVIHEIIEEDTGYLVLEYVPGQTLAERIAKGPLKLEEALSIALQLAEAVAAAHEHDVIHRDLKPRNIKIMPEGRVKVLDFGLAKPAGGEAESQDITVTQIGSIIGTPAYMSPQQIRGGPIDHRADIWSFGCVLYEMLTGKRPFEGDTVSDTVAHILERQPDWDLLPQETPANIRVLLRRCLKKNSQQRLRDIGDAFIEIQETLNLPADIPPQITTLQTDQRQLGWLRLIIVMTVGVIIGGILIGAVIWGLWPSDSITRAAVKSFSITPGTELSLEAQTHHALAFSPDGRLLAYIEQGKDWRTRIYLRSMEKFEATVLSGTEGAISPFFSPDGQWVAYVDHIQRTLKKVSIHGGEPISLAECGQFRGGSWGTDDRIVFTPLNTGGLWRISASGESLEELTRPDPNLGEWGHSWPQILPDGEHVLFTNERRGLDQTEVYSLKTGKHRVLFKGGSYARYLPTGHIMYGREEAVYAVAFDLTSYEVSGSHVPVVSDVITSHLGSAQFTFAQDGSLAYIPAKAQHTELEPVWVMKDGTTSLLAMTKRNYHSVSVSPDGAYAAFRVPLHGERDGELWIYDLKRQTANRLARGIGISTPVWTPDSNEVIYNRYEGSNKLLRQKIDGIEEPKLVAQFGIWTAPTSCSPDGKVLLAIRNDPNQPKLDADIWIVPLDKDSTATAGPLIERLNNQKYGVWSPDGRWIAYGSDESGGREIYIEPYPGPGPKTKISTNGGLQPVWSRDGKELFYRSGGKMMVAATIDTEPQLRVIDHKELFEWNYLSCTICQTYDVAPDGRFLMIQGPKESPPQRINVILNWFDELKRLVPPGKE